MKMISPLPTGRVSVRWSSSFSLYYRCLPSGQLERTRYSSRVFFDRRILVPFRNSTRTLDDSNSGSVCDSGLRACLLCNCSIRDIQLGRCRKPLVKLVPIPPKTAKQYELNLVCFCSLLHSKILGRLIPQLYFVPGNPFYLASKLANVSAPLSGSPDTRRHPGSPVEFLVVDH